MCVLLPRLQTKRRCRFYMGQKERRIVAAETLRITAQGYYKKDRQTIKLLGTNFDAVEVITLPAAKNAAHNFTPDKNSDGAHIYVVETDSFAAAEGVENCLVMNFANAHTPGGGFLHGANAQEEALCRESTLYESLSSRKASKMYGYNTVHANPCYSDYMLLSPKVCVFRNIEDNLLAAPFVTSVITLPAPNLYGEAKEVPQNILDKAMKNRLAKMFAVAAFYGYKNLVLGAWGCGALGHDPHNVAGYFYDLLINENYKSRFETIIFAIIDRDEKTNLRTFAKIFQNEATVYFNTEPTEDNSAPQTTEKFFVQAQKQFPPIRFNFTLNEINAGNLGFAYGIINAGIPFMAELMEVGGNRIVTFYLPLLEKIAKHSDETPAGSFSDVQNSTVQENMKLSPVLCMGMTISREIESLGVLNSYVKLLTDAKLIEFIDFVCNGTAWLLTDTAGNDLVALHISLTDDNETVAKTPLAWTPFQKIGHNIHLRSLR